MLLSPHPIRQAEVRGWPVIERQNWSDQRIGWLSRSLFPRGATTLQLKILTSLSLSYRTTHSSEPAKEPLKKNTKVLALFFYINLRVLRYIIEWPCDITVPVSYLYQCLRFNSRCSCTINESNRSVWDDEVLTYINIYIYIYIERERERERRERKIFVQHQGKINCKNGNIVLITIKINF